MGDEVTGAIKQSIGNQRREIMLIEKTLKFEVAPIDAPKLMTWREADAYAKSLGEGWRLPTKEELLLMYEKREEIGGFTTVSGSDYAHWFWSCTERKDSPSDVWNVRFTDGYGGWTDKDFDKLSSRLVRAELPA